jgi:hypothetical protein
VEPERDELELENCYNNLYLENSTIKIKKIKIVNGTNGFSLSDSNLTVTNSFNVTIIVTGTLFDGFSNSILIEECASFILNAADAGENILFVSEDSRVNGTTQTNVPYAFNIRKLEEEVFIFPNI